jgi:hypothetical protein
MAPARLPMPAKFFADLLPKRFCHSARMRSRLAAAQPKSFLIISCSSPSG